ncbi:hypothetical protein [Sphingomonas sp. MMS24-J13]|uniref:hypothetical protein n=1 Tax=Sphingomonas sp. MMS24-J13 TaxID=3238686 RepID=UPI00384E4F75
MDERRDVDIALPPEQLGRDGSYRVCKREIAIGAVQIQLAVEMALVCGDRII